MKLLLYKILCFPLRLSSFFKYGVPYAYLSRNKNKYDVVWYFNNNGIEKPKSAYFNSKKKLKKYNYSNQKFLGFKLSLKLSYIQIFKLFIK